MVSLSVTAILRCIPSFGNHNFDVMRPLAKYERVCYDIPMKWATGPLLFLGACRIHSALEANHRESPCGRRAEGTTQGARPSEEAWDRSQCRYKAQALWSHPAPLRFRYGAITVPLQFPYGSFTACYALLRLCYGSTTTGAGGRRKNSSAYNQRTRLRPGADPLFLPGCSGGRLRWGSPPPSSLFGPAALHGLARTIPNVPGK